MAERALRINRAIMEIHVINRRNRTKMRRLIGSPHAHYARDNEDRHDDGDGLHGEVHLVRLLVVDGENGLTLVAAGFRPVSVTTPPRGFSPTWRVKPVTTGPTTMRDGASFSKNLSFSSRILSQLRDAEQPLLVFSAPVV